VPARICPVFSVKLQASPRHLRPLRRSAQQHGPKDRCPGRRHGPSLAVGGPGMKATASASRLVLVVDEDDDIRTAVHGVLEGEGYATEGAPNGKKALEILHTSNDPPALVLLDLMMPEMDGWQLLVHMSEDAALCNIPVALMSAHPSLRQAFEGDRKKLVS